MFNIPYEMVKSQMVSANVNERCTLVFALVLYWDDMSLRAHQISGTVFPCMTSRLMETCSPAGVHSLSPEDEEDIKGVAGTMYAGEHPTVHSSSKSIIADHRKTTSCRGYSQSNYFHRNFALTSFVDCLCHVNLCPDYAATSRSAQKSSSRNGRRLRYRQAPNFRRPKLVALPRVYHQRSMQVRPYDHHITAFDLSCRLCIDGMLLFPWAYHIG